MKWESRKIEKAFKYYSEKGKYFLNIHTANRRIGKTHLVKSVIEETIVNSKFKSYDVLVISPSFSLSQTIEKRVAVGLPTGCHFLRASAENFEEILRNNRYREKIYVFADEIKVFKEEVIAANPNSDLILSVFCDDTIDDDLEEYERLMSLEIAKKRVGMKMKFLTKSER